MMHELIDREDPRCLYCNSECNLRQVGDMMLAPVGHPQFRMRFECQILTCQKCHEKFEIHWTESQHDETEYYAFVFTCKKIVVFNHYSSGFTVGGKELLIKEDYDILWGGKNWMPPFGVDFSDKKKLHKKLKTYLVFS